MKKRKTRQKRGPVAATASVNISGFSPRPWQVEAADACVASAQSGAKSALVCACPGAGKTYGSLNIASELRDNVFPQVRLIIVTPNKAVKSQWIKRANGLGFELLPIKTASDLDQGFLNIGEVGFILNYQQLIKPLIKEKLRVFCNRHKVIVVFDEVHHAADDSGELEGNVWGVSGVYAFAEAVFVLCTTGTPFRRGEAPIAFVQYKKNGDVQPTYTYKYHTAIIEHVCRPIEFALWDGSVRWKDRKSGNVIESPDFKTEIEEKWQRQRLLASITAEGDCDFLFDMLSAADKQLNEIRVTAADAAGLIVAVDINNANLIKKYIDGISGEESVIVNSEIDEAQDKIDEFRSSKKKWIVGVGMLSEGVDIPRLRVGVYATNIKSPLYFHQFCGRVMRVENPDGVEWAFIFMPADEDLEGIALTIEEERCRAFGEEYEPKLKRKGSGGTPRARPEGIVVLESSGIEGAYISRGSKTDAADVTTHKEMLTKFDKIHPDMSHIGKIQKLKIIANSQRVAEIGAANGGN